MTLNAKLWAAQRTFWANKHLPNLHPPHFRLDTLELRQTSSFQFRSGLRSGNAVETQSATRRCITARAKLKLIVSTMPRPLQTLEHCVSTVHNPSTTPRTIEVV